jgi:hypothetical protein
MTSDISNLNHFFFFAQDPPDGDISGPASLEMAMIAVLPKLAKIGPVSLNRAGKLQFSKQQLKSLINAPGKSLEPFADISS